VLTSFDVKLVLGCSHYVDVGSVADILDVHTASIFMVEVCTVGEFLYKYRFMFRFCIYIYIYRFMFQKDNKEVGLGASAQSRPTYTVVRESCESKEMTLLRAMKCTKK
jgi:hypothetical protein